MKDIMEREKTRLKVKTVMALSTQPQGVVTQRPCLKTLLWLGHRTIGKQVGLIL
jgi:hypothetical protein